MTRQHARDALVDEIPHQDARLSPLAAPDVYLARAHAAGHFTGLGKETARLLESIIASQHETSHA